MIVSTSRSVPSAPTTVCSRTSASAEAMTSTLALVSAGYQSLEGSTRLQPNV